MGLRAQSAGHAVGIDCRLGIWLYLPAGVWVAVELLDLAGQRSRARRGADSNGRTACTITFSAYSCEVSAWPFNFGRSRDFVGIARLVRCVVVGNSRARGVG